MIGRPVGMAPLACIVLDKTGIEKPAVNPHHKPAQPMATPTPSQAARIQTLRILSGRLLRQYQVAAELGLAEHHNYGTHSLLEELIREELVSYVYIHEINRDGKPSKLSYRNFYLTHKGSQAIRTHRPGMRTRDILSNWARALGF